MEKVLIFLLLIWTDELSVLQPARKIPFATVQKCEFYRSQVRYPAHALCIPTLVPKGTVKY